jgi:hypothetical protein
VKVLALQQTIGGVSSFGCTMIPLINDKMMAINIIEKLLDKFAARMILINPSNK